jgi:hypothetical protein
MGRKEWDEDTTFEVSARKYPLKILLAVDVSYCRLGYIAAWEGIYVHY